MYEVIIQSDTNFIRTTCHRGMTDDNNDIMRMIDCMRLIVREVGPSCQAKEDVSHHENGDAACIV